MNETETPENLSPKEKEVFSFIRTNSPALADVVAEVLWPERDGYAARHVLKTTICHIRRKIAGTNMRICTEKKPTDRHVSYRMTVN